MAIGKSLPSCVGPFRMNHLQAETVSPYRLVFRITAARGFLRAVVRTRGVRFSVPWRHSCRHMPDVEMNLSERPLNRAPQSGRPGASRSLSSREMGQKRQNITPFSF